MRRTIKLLGEPAIHDAGGRSRKVRGYKAWAILARLLLARFPLDRPALAAELFADADDPLGSLRWCLASLRNALGSPHCLSGDPIVHNLPADVGVDVWCLEEADFDIEGAGVLLQGIEPKACPDFSTWLLVERERIASLIASRLRQDTMLAISSEDSERAIRLAELAVRRTPYDEGTHVLLVKSLVLADRHEAALKHIEATEALFLGELGCRPSPALRSAARRTVSSPPLGISRATYARTLIELGLAALSAGAPDAGIDLLRCAAHDAQQSDDPHLLARSLLELGSALIHFARGYADEGTIYLRQSADVARQRGYADIAATALRELGFVECKAGRRPAAATHLAEALSLVQDSDSLSGIYAVNGLNLVDWGRVEEGLAHFELALEHARRRGNRRREIFSLGNGARGLMAADRLDRADLWLEACLALIEEQRWIAFRPWPVALLSESKLRQKEDPVALRHQLEGAFALSCQLSDPCWEVAVARTIALTHAAETDLPRATEWLAEARRRCVRAANLYVAVHVEVLASQTEVSMAADKPDLVDSYAREWLSLAARAHMDAHVARAAGVIASSKSQAQARSTCRPRVTTSIQSRMSSPS